MLEGSGTKVDFKKQVFRYPSGMVMAKQSIDENVSAENDFKMAA